MIEDEAPEPASQTEEMPSQKRAVLEESPSDSTDHLEGKEMGRTQAKERGNSWFNPAVSVQGLCSKEERRKLIETKILTKIIVAPSPKQDVKPPSHGIHNGLGRPAKAETSSAEHFGEVTHLSLQASGPEMTLCVWWGHSECCTIPLQGGSGVPSADTPQEWVLHRHQKLSHSCHCKPKPWQKPWISSKAHELLREGNHSIYPCEGKEFFRSQADFALKQ